MPIYNKIIIKSLIKQRKEETVLKVFNIEKLIQLAWWGGIGDVPNTREKTVHSALSSLMNIVEIYYWPKKAEGNDKYPDGELKNKKRKEK